MWYSTIKTVDMKKHFNRFVNWVLNLFGVKRESVEPKSQNWGHVPHVLMTRQDYRDAISKFMNPEYVNIIETVAPQGVILLNMDENNLEKFKEMIPYIESRRPVYHQVYYALSPK